jgi:hypothetical protein
MAPSSSSRPLRHHQPLLLILAIFVSGLLASVPASAADGRPELGGDGLHREILRDETVLRLKELGKISDGEGYLERTFLSPASIRATAVIISWMKEAGLTTYVCLCSAVVFSHFDLDLPISVQREGGLIKWGIFTVGLSRKILPKRPY